MPNEPSPYWWPIALIACSIVGIGAVWFTRWVTERLDRDRTKLHEHASMLHVHEYKHEETHERLTKVEDGVKELKDGKPNHGRRP